MERDAPDVAPLEKGGLASQIRNENFDEGSAGDPGDRCGLIGQIILKLTALVGKETARHQEGSKIGTADRRPCPVNGLLWRPHCAGGTVGATLLLQDDPYEYPRSDFKLADHEDGAGTLGFIHDDVEIAWMIMGMADDPRAGRHRTASAWRWLMAGRAIRIPEAAFARRRIVSRWDMQTRVAMLVEVRATPRSLPLSPFLAVFFVRPVLF
jgi:hypothetical protein